MTLAPSRLDDLDTCVRISVVASTDTNIETLLTISRRKHHMQGVIIPKMNMSNLALHSPRKTRSRKMIRQEDPIGMAFQIRPSQLNKMMIPTSKGFKDTTQFLPTY